MNKTLFSLALLAFGSLANAQTVPEGMVGLTKAEQLAYSASCTTPQGLNHSCPKGHVVAIKADGSAMCRPDPKILPFAFKGEKPCGSQKVAEK